MAVLLLRLTVQTSKCKDGLHETTELLLPGFFYGAKRGERSRLLLFAVRAQELCESPGGRLGLPSVISLRFLWT